MNPFTVTENCSLSSFITCKNDFINANISSSNIKLVIKMICIDKQSIKCSNLEKLKLHVNLMSAVESYHMLASHLFVNKIKNYWKQEFAIQSNNWKNISLNYLKFIFISKTKQNPVKLIQLNDASDNFFFSSSFFHH